MGKAINEIEKQFIRDNAETMKDKDAVELFNRTFGKTMRLSSYRAARAALGITKKRGRGVCGLQTYKVEACVGLETH